MRIDAGDVELEAVIRGPDDGLPVVLIHGFPLSHRMWEPQLAALSDRCRVIAYDVRGLGRSGVGDGQYTMELFVDDLFRVLDEVDSGPVVGGGLSMGGYVLLRALEREPERFLAAVLADTRSVGDDNATRLGRARAIRILKEEGADAYADEVLAKLLGPTTRSRSPEVVEAAKEMVRSNDPRGMVGAQLAMLSRTDTTGGLGEIEVPVLVAVGEEDELTPPAGAREMAGRVPDARTAVIPGAGHVSALERPEPFNEALRDFLDGVE